MNAIFTIAWRDLRSFFSSFRGAIILAAFLCLTGFFFSSFVYSFMEMQSRGSAMGGQGPTLDQLLKALFYNMHFLIILVIPAVTMSTFAEERKNHTIRLLQTAPVTPLQIVLGKFLAASGMLIIVLLCASVYPLFCMLYGNPDLGVLLTSYLGLIFLISGTWQSRTFLKMAASLLPVKRRSLASNSHSTMPSANTSVRGSIGWPSACSGLM